MTKLPLFPTLGQSLKKTFSELYQSMSLSFLYSIIWFITHLPVIILMPVNIYAVIKGLQSGIEVNGIIVAFSVYMLLIVFWYGLVAGPTITALYGLLQVRKEDYIGIKTFIEIFRSHYWLSARVYWVVTLALSILSTNLIIGLLSKNLIFLGISIFSFYLVFLLMLMSFYISPLIYFKNKFRSVFKKALLLALDNFWLSVLFGVFIGIVLLISIIIAVPLFFVFGAFYLLLMDNGFQAILQKYDSEKNNENNEIDGGENDD